MMLETIREYAREQLVAEGEAAILDAAHARYFLAYAEVAAPHLESGPPRAWLDGLETEHDNLRAALAWSLAAPDGALALRLGSALVNFWHLRNHWREGRQWLERCLAAGAGAVGPPANHLQAEAHLGLSTLCAAWPISRQARVRCATQPPPVCQCRPAGPAGAAAPADGIP